MCPKPSVGLNSVSALRLTVRNSGDGQEASLGVRIQSRVDQPKRQMSAAFLATVLAAFRPYLRFAPRYDP